MKLQQMTLSFLFFIALVALISSCVVPVNTSLESARMLGSGNFELTGSYATYRAYSDGESERTNDNIGLRLGYGISDAFDLKVRYLRMLSAVEDSPDVNYLALAPKISLSENRLALTAPIGLYFVSDEGESESTGFVSPRIIYTIPAPNDMVEFSVSTKADFYFEKDSDPTIGFNAGAGFSGDLDRWAIRPEIGLLFPTGRDSEGTVWTFGIGATVVFGQ